LQARWLIIFAMTTVAPWAVGAPDEEDPALLTPLNEAVGISEPERESAPDLMRAMLRIQHAYLLDEHTVPQSVASYDRCLTSKIGGGNYSFTDGGVSAWRLRLACDASAKVLIDNCKKRFKISASAFFPHCSIEPILLAQAAMYVIEH
jgi:hypothetical protein